MERKTVKHFKYLFFFLCSNMQFFLKLVRGAYFFKNQQQCWSGKSAKKSILRPLSHNRPPRIRLSVFQADPSRPPMAGGSQRRYVCWRPTAIRSDKIRSEQTDGDAFAIHPADRMKTDRRSVLIWSPHREQRGSDRSVPAQWAETDLLPACSAGIKGVIPTPS